MRILGLKTRKQLEVGENYTVRSLTTYALNIIRLVKSLKSLGSVRRNME
jgi:hypothetical protein